MGRVQDTPSGVRLEQGALLDNCRPLFRRRPTRPLDLSSRFFAVFGLRIGQIAQLKKLRRFSAVTVEGSPVEVFSFVVMRFRVYALRFQFGR